MLRRAHFAWWAFPKRHRVKLWCDCYNSQGADFGASQDTPEAREDQQHIKDPYNKHTDKGHQYLSSYTLTKAENKIFFECLSSIKVPAGFSSNIKGIINMAEKKFQNLKSHDCHVIMTQLLLVALRGASTGK
jgi:hypothetical protein